MHLSLRMLSIRFPWYFEIFENFYFLEWSIQNLSKWLFPFSIFNSQASLLYFQTTRDWTHQWRCCQRIDWDWTRFVSEDWREQTAIRNKYSEWKQANSWRITKITVNNEGIHCNLFMIHRKWSISKMHLFIVTICPLWQLLSSLVNLLMYLLSILLLILVFNRNSLRNFVGNAPFDIIKDDIIDSYNARLEKFNEQFEQLKTMKDTVFDMLSELSIENNSWIESILRRSPNDY